MEKFNSKSTVATSSATENRFGTIKSHIFNKKKGMRLDKYVEKSIDTLDGHFKSLLAKTKTEKLVIESKQESEEDSEVPAKRSKQIKTKKSTPKHAKKRTQA